jgi:hypothetical protein
MATATAPAPTRTERKPNGRTDFFKGRLDVTHESVVEGAGATQRTTVYDDRTKFNTIHVVYTRGKGVTFTFDSVEDFAEHIADQQVALEALRANT